MFTDEALIAETAVWPNFFLMNIFFALKGSKLFIIIYVGYSKHFYIQNIQASSCVVSKKVYS